jgi:hypothetical protein
MVRVEPARPGHHAPEARARKKEAGRGARFGEYQDGACAQAMVLSGMVIPKGTPLVAQPPPMARS